MTSSASVRMSEVLHLVDGSCRNARAVTSCNWAGNAEGRDGIIIVPKSGWLRPTMFSHRRDWLSCTPSLSAFAKGCAVIGQGATPRREKGGPLVNGTEEATGEIAFIDARGDAVLNRGRDHPHEYIVGFVLVAAVQIVAKVPLITALAWGPSSWFLLRAAAGSRHPPGDAGRWS